MSNFLTQYEAVLNCAVEAANAYLDMEGGEFLLAWTGELIQGLVAEGDFVGAFLTARRMCEAVGVECDWISWEGCGEEAADVWPSLFAEVLMEYSPTATK